MVRCSAPDWDDLLAYTAPKTVSVRHKWVGIVYYVTLIAIVGYVVGYEIIMKKGYTKFDMLAGSVRATLQPAALSALAPIARAGAAPLRIRGARTGAGSARRPDLRRSARRKRPQTRCTLHARNAS